MMEIDVFDFDKTIYKGDSTIDFWLFSIKQQPFLLLLLPFQVFGFLLYALKIVPLGTAKAWLLSFMRFIDGEQAVAAFWQKNSYKLCDWFNESFMERETIVATASPEFLVAPACMDKGVAHVLGTRANIHTGKITGKNCKGAEKLSRIAEIYPNMVIIRAFSDDEKADLPLFMAAFIGYLVKNGEIEERYEGL